MAYVKHIYTVAVVGRSNPGEVFSPDFMPTSGKRLSVSKLGSQMAAFCFVGW